MAALRRHLDEGAVNEACEVFAHRRPCHPADRGQLTCGEGSSVEQGTQHRGPGWIADETGCGCEVDVVHGVDTMTSTFRCLPNRSVMRLVVCNPLRSNRSRVTPNRCDWPSDPFDAVTRPDPWPYYDDLAKSRVHWHEGVRGWIASSLRDVSAVLGNSLCDVRPQSGRVPVHLAGTRAGDLFERLVRMTDGPRHAIPKRSIEGVLSSLDPRRVEQACVAAADRAVAGGAALNEPDTWMHDYPTAVLAELLEARDDELVTVTRSARCLAAAFAPGPQPLEGTDVDAAADMLLDLASRSGVLADLLRVLIVGTTDDAVEHRSCTNTSATRNAWLPKSCLPSSPVQGPRSTTKCTVSQHQPTWPATFAITVAASCTPCCNRVRCSSVGS